MPCFLAVLALFVPRVVIVLLWFFSTWFEGIFETILWPLLGFIFAPTTMLWYSVVQNVYDGMWGALQLVVLVIAVLIDLSPASGRRD